MDKQDLINFELRVKEAYEEISLNFTNKEETEVETEDGVIFNEVDEIEKEFEDIESNHSDENNFIEEEKGLLFQCDTKPECSFRYAFTHPGLSPIWAYCTIMF